MKLLQYLILTILIANGSWPILKDTVISYSDSAVLVEFFSSLEETNCEEQENESEGASDENLTTPDHHVLHEPKPHDSHTGSAYPTDTASVEDYNQPDIEGSWSILAEHLSANIDSKLLDRVYFSKSNQQVLS